MPSWKRSRPIKPRTQPVYAKKFRKEHAARMVRYPLRMEYQTDYTAQMAAFLSRPSVKRLTKGLSWNARKLLPELMDESKNERYWIIEGKLKGIAEMEGARFIPVLEALSRQRGLAFMVPELALTLLTGLEKSLGADQAKPLSSGNRLTVFRLLARSARGKRKRPLVSLAATKALTHLKPASRRLHPLYAPAYRERDYSFFQGPRIRARKFKKTGSRLLVLGGRHAGKAIIRIVRPEAFEAWKKAFDAGLAVEPILKSPNGKPWFWKDKNGYVWVMAKVLGTTVDAYLNSAEAERHPEHRAELVRQVEELDRKLLDLGIHHNHAHFGNACIEWERRDGKRQPKAYLIDFDAAWVSKAMLRGGHGETTSS